MAFVMAAAPASNSCIVLTNTKTCAAQEGQPVLTGAYYNSTETFDDFINQSFDDNPAYVQGFKSGFDCPNYDGSGQRYHLTFYCAWLVRASAASCKSFGVTPTKAALPLCRSTCLAARDSLVRLFTNPTYCSAAPNAQALTTRTESQNAYTSMCGVLKLNSGAGCDSGTLASEINTCGFIHAPEALTFCKNASKNGATIDPCCKQVEGFEFPTDSPVSKGVIVGISLGAIFAVIALIYAFFVFKARRQRQNRGDVGVYNSAGSGRSAASTRSDMKERNRPRSGSLHSLAIGKEKDMFRGVGYDEERIFSASSSNHHDLYSPRSPMSPPFTPNRSSRIPLMTHRGSFAVTSPPPNIPLPSLPRGPEDTPTSPSPSHDPFHSPAASNPYRLTELLTPETHSLNGSTIAGSHRSRSTLATLTAREEATAATAAVAVAGRKPSVRTDIQPTRMRVWAEYVPNVNEPDELELRVGDVVLVVETYSDGK
ncbi:uncharacterized protein EV422DRAFT_542786 [Fimicolochytrium jonesii]|uniref:uncharacterized protein n=1 Tax=Fimicolochytrium jonesii TaxID=1396493 RepID=UPI0022FED1DB|nr:uncharacterized protein EV422DRAFT_542786 [Fimicolochytrium jonesii]KAI8817187.1 hypothetical protein EV422DRAFT_542786 [Fimicolochytrium jonesii]